MKSALAVIAACMFSCLVIQGAERGFDDVVRAVSDHLHTRPLRIPLFGLIHLATFAADGDTEPYVAEALRSAGEGWSPFVRVRNHSETVLVYMAPQRSDCKVLVVATKHGQITVVELKLNSETLQAWLREPDVAAVRSASR